MLTVAPDKLPDSASRAVADECPEDRDSVDVQDKASGRQKEIGGRNGPDPTRYGDWEKAGRCIDF